MQSLGQSQSPSASQRFLPLLTLLFIGSGCSALIYEVVWLQLLQLVIGSSAVSLGVLLGTFMGGMCLGSLVLPRVVSARRHPLRVYALMELGIGIAGIALLFGMPYVDQIYAAHVRPGLASILLRGAVCAICLLPPTMLMGATLPAIARWVEATPRGVSWLGFFYGGNIAGAVFGCLLAGFYLLRVHDGAIATYVAAAINFIVAVTAVLLAGRTATSQRRLAGWACPPTCGARARWHSPPYGISNAGDLDRLRRDRAVRSDRAGGRGRLDAAAVAAARRDGLHVLHHSGGLSGGAGHRQQHRVGDLPPQSRPRLALGVCQLLLMGAIAWAAYALADSLPYWPINPSLSRSPWFNFQLDLMRCVWAVLPGAILWGASFPLALASVARRGATPAGWSAACTRPTRSARSSARWPSAWC